MKKIWSLKDLISIFLIVGVLLSIAVITIKLLDLDIAASSLIVDISFFIIVLGVIWFFLKKKNVSWHEFGLKDHKFKWFVISMLLVFITLFVGTFLSNLFSRLLGLDNTNVLAVKEILSDKMWLNIVNLKVVMVFLIPIAEEFLFKGVLYRYIRYRKSFLISAILTSVVFSLIHFNLAALPFLLLLGFTTAYVFEKTDSIFYPIIIHGGVNAMAANMILFSIL